MITHMIRKEFRQLRRDKRMLVIVLVAPVLMVLLLGYAANLDPQNIPLIICDQDHTPQSRELYGAFFSSGYFLSAGYAGTPGDIEQVMESEGASAALLIPRGFGAGLQGGFSPQVSYIADGSDSTTATIAMGYAAGIVRMYGAKISEMDTESLSVIDVRTRIFFNPALRSRNFMVPGLLAMILMVMTLILTSLAVVKEKEIGTMEQLIVTPLSTVDILLGKLLPFAIIGVVDVVLAITVTKLIFGLKMAGSLPLLFGLSMIFLLNTLGLGLLVSTFSNNQQQAMMASVFFVILPMIILSGFVFPVENMPVPIRALTYVMPLRYFFTIVRGIYLKGAGIAELRDEGLALLILGVTILSISIMRFHKRLE